MSVFVLVDRLKTLNGELSNVCMRIFDGTYLTELRWINFTEQQFHQKITIIFNDLVTLYINSITTLRVGVVSEMCLPPL